MIVFKINGCPQLTEFVADGSHFGVQQTVDASANEKLRPTNDSPRARWYPRIKVVIRLRTLKLALRFGESLTHIQNMKHTTHRV